MDGNSSFYYKRVEKATIEKIKTCNTPPLSNKRFEFQQKPVIKIASSSSKYSSRNFSSIKTLIKRIEASGASKLNYPKMKPRNQRSDIFLLGGHISSSQNQKFQSVPSYNQQLYSKANIPNNLQQRQPRLLQRQQAKVTKGPNINPQQNRLDRTNIASRKRFDEFQESIRQRSSVDSSDKKQPLFKGNGMQHSVQVSEGAHIVALVPKMSSVGSNRYKASLQRVSSTNQQIDVNAYKKNYYKNSILENQLSNEERRYLVSLKLKELQELASHQYLGDQISELDPINHFIKRTLRDKTAGSEGKDYQQILRCPASEHNMQNAKIQSKTRFANKSVNLKERAKEHDPSERKSTKKRKNPANKDRVSIDNKKATEKNINKPLFYFSQPELRGMGITARNFIVSEYPSGQIITGVHSKQVCEVASLTKIVTFFCCLKIVEKYSLNIDKQLIKIDQQVESISGTSAELFEGDIYTVRQLCYGMMLPSGNDAALALSKWAGGVLLKNYRTVSGNWSDSIGPAQASYKAFMSFLNQTCEEIGMKCSFFGNPHGLPHSKSGTTLQDMATVINQSLAFEFFRTVVRTKKFSCWISNDGVSREVVWENTNKLLRRDGFIGIKTGVTVTAGPCLATCYERNGKIYTVVLLKTTKLSKRFKETRWILGRCLLKLGSKGSDSEIRKILRNDAEFDSDNSEEEQEFNYERNDAREMNRRMKIITYEM